MGRKSDGFRDVSVLLGALENKDGSAIFRSGRTEVACGVIGPVESRSARDTFEGLVVDVSTRTNAGLPNSTHKQIDVLVSDIVLRSLDSRKYPYTQLFVTIDVLSDDGSLMGVIGNAVHLALLDSTLPLVQRLVSFSVGLVDGEFTVDLDTSLESACSGWLTVFMNMDSSDPLYAIQESGIISKDAYRDIYGLLGRYRDALHNQITLSTRYSDNKFRFSR
jgi:ribonuclease PH